MSKERNIGAKKYFLFAIKKYIDNKNKIIAKKFSPSVRELIYNYIEIYEDMISNLENQKLKNSKIELINSISFYLKESIFYKENIYKEELKYILTDFEKIKNNSMSQAEENRVYNKCKALVKKIDNENIYLKLINIVKEIESYELADKIIESFVSELLYDEVSIKYLSDWYNANIARELNSLDSKKIDFLLDRFKNLYLKENEFTYYISIKSRNKLEDKIYLDCNLILNKEDYNKIQLIDEESDKDSKSFLINGGDNNIYSINVRCKDYYRCLELITDTINSYFQMINYMDDSNEVLLNDKVVIRTNDGKYIKKRNEKFDVNILFNNSERREKRDIKDFIEYRDKVYLNRIEHDEITNIQRAINIIKNQKEQSKENRLINLWSVLEYMLTFHEGNSIIAKVKDIIPKVICLYYIKDKINMFWYDLNLYKNSSINIIHEIIEKCKLENDEYRYDLGKFLIYLESKGSKIMGEFDFNDNLKREIAEIGMLLFNADNRKNSIEKIYMNTEMDLIRIYRDRNILIHYGRRNIKNIDYKSLRLNYYNNAVIGVIIHYKKNNPQLTIEEILNSIEYTYDKYIRDIGNKFSGEALIGICRIKYLFIS